MHVFLAAALLEVCGELLAPVALSPVKGAPYNLGGKLSGSNRRCGLYEEGKMLTLPGLEF
jgi:hypothetical protein